MSPLSSWIGGSKPADADEHQAELAAERANLEYAMRATNLVINDDIDTAKKLLTEGASSVYNDLGIALISFLMAILGFEKTNRDAAAKLLAECETRASQDLKHARGRPSASHIFPAGTEYEIIVAQTQIMSAVVGVLNESLIDAMSGCLKLRRAYNTLAALMARETEYLEKQQRTHAGSGSAAVASARASTEGKNVFSAAQTPSSSRTSVDDGAPGTTSPAPRETDVEPENPVDAFIHSGINLCMGLLMLMMSQLPPAFARVLAVVGFTGDRAKGMQMLWRATAYHNANGAFAGLALLTFYHNVVALTDIKPHEGDFDKAAELYGLPMEKLGDLLATFRTRFPQSRMWLIEGAKRLAIRRDLPAAIELLESGEEGKMAQIKAVNAFQSALFSMSAQDWPRMRKYFLEVVEVNTWSKALYYYMAGVASLELYRDAVARGDATAAAAEKEEAERHLWNCRHKSAKKTFLARPLPFEAFVQRKLRRWEARSKALGVDLADAVSVSPAVEMMFLWGTMTMMSARELDKAQECLAWSRLTAPADKLDKLQERDELGVRAICMASMLRGGEQLAEARTVLQEGVLSHDRNLFKGGDRDDYVVPAALHELAAIAWAECGQPPAGVEASGLEAYQRAKFDECDEHLERLRAWESYVMDGRLGMRIQCGLSTLGWYREKKGWATE